ncbi:MAG: DUF2207 domain-containing protein [Aerococcus sp.]|nr:DUF2207 domain-containing protein [Aerococcus sp.]
MTGKKHAWYIGLLLCFLCILGWLSPAVVHAERVDSYRADIQTAKDGRVTLTEKVSYTIDDPIEQLNHRITMNDSQELNDITISMQAAGQKDAFPFAESDTAEIGTFSANSQGHDLLITLNNKMADEQQTVTYRTEWLATWVKYGNKEILDYPILSVPYDLKEATITFHFPDDAHQSVAYLLEGIDHYQVNWLDAKTLQVTAYAIKANAHGQLLVNAPSTLVPDNRTEGPQSKGEQLARHIDTVNQEATQRTHWQTQTIRIIFWLVIITVLLYTIALWHRKWHHRPKTTNWQQWQYQSAVQTPVILPFISRCTYSDASLFWLIMFQLVAEEHLTMRWEYDETGEPIEAYFRVRSRHAQTAPEQAVLHYMARFEGVSELSYNQLVYGAGKTKQKPQPAFRKVMSQIKRQMKQQLRDQAIYDRVGNRLYQILWFMIVFILISSLIVSAILTVTANQSFGYSLGIVLSLLWLFVLKRAMFPIYLPDGIQLKRYFQHYLNQLPVKQKPIKGWALDYVYSWAIGKNREQYAMMEKRGIVAHHPVLGMFAPIHQKRLKELNSRH